MSGSMKVLVAVDASLAASSIVETLFSHPWPNGTQFYLVTVVEETTGPFSPVAYQSEADKVAWTKFASSNLAGLLDKVRNQLPQHTFFAEVIHGGPVETIVRKADEIRADLIVIGHQGTYGSGGYSLGGVAEGVTQKAHCSVVVIKPRIRQQQTEDNKKVEQGVAAL